MSSCTVFRILLLVQFHLLLVRPQTVSIDSSDSFSSLRSCAQSPFNNYGSNLGYHLSCDWPAENSCFCRADLQQDATSYVSSKVAAQCNRNDLDVSSAVSLYTSYCANIGPAATPATTTGASAVTLTVTIISEPAATATATETATVTVTVRSGVATAPATSAVSLLLAFLPLCALVFG